MKTDIRTLASVNPNVMGRIEMRIIATLLLSNLVVGCVFFKSTENHTDAKYTKIESGYEITLTRDRFLNSHHIVSALAGKTYEEKYSLIVPRIEGEVSVKGIPNLEKCFGTVDFLDSNMTINIYCLHYENNSKIPFNWNGRYILEKLGKSD